MFSCCLVEEQDKDASLVGGDTGDIAVDVVNDDGALPKLMEQKAFQTPDVNITKDGDMAVKDIAKAYGARSFEVQLESSSAIGVTLDYGTCAQEIVVITDVHEGGAAWTWNQTCALEKRILHGDGILEAGGFIEPQAIADFIDKLDPNQKITLLRPIELQIKFVRQAAGVAGGKIGLRTTPSGREGLLIREIKDGMVSDWNTANPGKDVRVGDRLVAVNGIKGDHQKIMTELIERATLDCVFCRHEVHSKGGENAQTNA